MDSETDSESDLPLTKLKSFKSEAMEFKTFIEKIRSQKAAGKKIINSGKAKSWSIPTSTTRKRKQFSPYLHPL